MFAKQHTFAALSIVLLVLSGSLTGMSSAHAGAADVEAATYEKAADGTYRFSVTVRHTDDGWEHYADIWQVIGPDGAVLGERVLLHPHDNEQPFTRNHSGIVIPSDTSRVTIRAHDKKHGWGGEELTVEIQE